LTDKQALEEKMGDAVNHPEHYTRGGIETIDFIIAKELSYELGNVVKYVSRAQFKGEHLQDLEKAQWYLNDAIDREKERLITEAKAETEDEHVGVERGESVRWPVAYPFDWATMLALGDE
jgi:hypothetical protein